MSNKTKSTTDATVKDDDQTIITPTEATKTYKKAVGILRKKITAGQHREEDKQTLTLSLATLEKAVEDIFKTHTPLKIKKIRLPENTGLGKARRIVEKAAAFLGCEPTDKRSRNDLTKAVCEHIKVNKLQIPGNMKYFMPDEELIDLLGLEQNKQYSYTDIQSYFRPLFIIEDTPCDKFNAFVAEHAKTCATCVFAANSGKKDMIVYLKTYVSIHQRRTKGYQILLDEPLKALLDTTATTISTSQMIKMCDALVV